MAVTAWCRAKVLCKGSMAIYRLGDVFIFDAVHLWQIRRMIIKEMMILNGRDVRIGASLLVDDMDSMVRFYRDTLGFHTGWDGGDFAEFETASGALSLFMYSRKQFVK
ncbi:MAG: VOC family protein, partial [Clostridium sp.]